jgi:hypothetical protein
MFEAGFGRLPMSTGGSAQSPLAATMRKELLVTVENAYRAGKALAILNGKPLEEAANFAYSEAMKELEKLYAADVAASEHANASANSGNADEPEKVVSITRQTHYSKPTHDTGANNSWRASEAVDERSSRNAAHTKMTPQELILDIVKQGEASIPDILEAFNNFGMDISPGHLSVMLTRMTQAGLIDREGRGRYTMRRQA